MPLRTVQDYLYRWNFSAQVPAVRAAERKPESGFKLNPQDELNDLRMSEKALPLLEHVKRFIRETVEPMSEEFHRLGEGNPNIWTYAPGQLEVLEAAKDTKGRKALAVRTGFNEKLLLKWANMADRLRVKGLGKDYAELVQAAGVDTVRELKYRNAKRLALAMQEANKRRKLVQFLPSEKAVSRWIEEAKTLDIKISY